MECAVSAALEKLRRGDEEAAFYDLVEIPGVVLPALIEVFRAEQDTAVRAFLVKVAWERRDPSALPFLGEALNHAQEEVWQAALDGLVAFASPESLDILRQARDHARADGIDTRRFSLWLEEAIQQVEFELRR
ncbi:MAG: HEAT repeat domain-containing protein [Candidatus Binatia bacterium]